MKALVLYNPAAGRIPVSRFVHSAADALKRMGWEVVVEATQSGAQATERAKQAAGQLDAVFAVGGDGTVGQVASGLAGSQTALGILPAGTMNVLGMEIGLQPFAWNRLWALEENIRALARAPIHLVDIGRCNNQHFMLWAGIGLDAVTIGQIEPRLRVDKFFTIPIYATQAVLNAATWKGQELRFWVDGQEISGQFLMAVVSNIRKYLGGLVTLSPDAYLDDGQMDLWLFPGSNMGDTVRHALDVATQQHVTSKNIQRVSFRQFRVESSSPLFLQMDGDPAPTTNQLEVEVQHRALRLMIPDRSLFMLKEAQQNTGKFSYSSR
jgi:YegS/Rv2252/BmrU family lipid kinase